ncbi:HI_0552 family protein [Enterococcus hirae]|uniref:HI_0552 family protein n=1 Tax=Enterococcus hirae TaxID=1354 RepID=UPI000F6B700E|nr:HI_0552 family protein [Enterococcus hirae]VEE84174.1 glucose-6-phosphate 1-dehydrogenase [Enterococcus hirae]
MDLLTSDYELFDRSMYTFKQLKESYTTEELVQLKVRYQTHWQKWKKMNEQVAKATPLQWQMRKPKIESWTNGWSLRSHFWCAYRSEGRQQENACLATLLNKKQFQIYLMFQHYKSEERQGSISSFNHLLTVLKEWSKHISVEEYYIWPQPEHELVDHLPLATYLTDKQKQIELKKAMEDKTFQLGKLYFYPNELKDAEKLILDGMQELIPLYLRLNGK